MRRVVITGLGVASGIGNDLQTFQHNLCEMNSAIAEIDLFDVSQYQVKIGSTVKNLKEKLSPRVRALPRTSQFLIHAANDALKQSGILDSVTDPTRIGAYIAGPACNVEESEKFYRQYVTEGFAKARAGDLLYTNWDSAVNLVGQEFNLMGPRNTILTACSSSGVAIGLAFDLIRMGMVDAMVAGGTDGYSEFTYSGFHALQSVSPYPCRPFDKSRAGLSFGEGAGVLILEDYDVAVKRGAKILAEIGGYGAIGEGFNLTAPHPDAFGYIRTMKKAMKMAQVNQEQITYINSHGTATPINDEVEAKAVLEVFGGRPVPVNSIKSLVGHCMGAAGAVEAVNCVITLMNNVIPGTKNFEESDSNININVIRQTRDANLEAVLCNSAGFGGNNSSVLFKRFA